MSQLADRIAADLSPLHPLSLETKNISGLSPAETANLRGTLESELQKRSFHVVSADATAATAQSVAKVQFTISEGAEGYVLIAETQSASEPDTKPQVAIVTAPKTAPGADQQPNDSLSLDKRLIWQQPTKFLDFALQTGPPQFYSTLVILEPERLVSYHSSSSQWQIWQTIPIPQPKPWPRDLHGTINVEGKSVSLPGVECVGDAFDLPRVKCAPLHLLKDYLPVDIPGHAGSLYVELFAQCGAGPVVLATGTGDWTQPDSIQGYFHTDTNRPAIPSGAPIELDGPVTALWREGRESSARAVVRNLKTGNYEGYIVTATCSH